MLTSTVCSTGSLGHNSVINGIVVFSLQGEQLGVPERVPFRLTHNMVHAMVRQNNLEQFIEHFVHLKGVTGYEGIFRKSCEVTLRLLREQSDPLMWYVKYFSISQ